MKKDYIVSFGNSNSYSVASELEADRLHEKIVESLKKRFPLGNVKNIATIDIREADAATAAKYPTLDEKAIEAICASLKRSMQVSAEDRELNSDAPFSDIN